MMHLKEKAYEGVINVVGAIRSYDAMWATAAKQCLILYVVKQAGGLESDFW